MDQIYARLAVSVSELKKNPTALLNQAEGQPIAMLNHNKPIAYIVPAELYEKIMDAIENDELVTLAKSRLSEKSKAIKVDLDDL
jgi:antitoxin StbD